MARRVWEWLVRRVPWTAFVGVTLLALTPLHDMAASEPIPAVFWLGMVLVVWTPGMARMLRIYRATMTAQDPRR